MTPAVWPRARRESTRLLLIDSDTGSMVDAAIGDLPRVLREGDLLVLNDAATVPASLTGMTPLGRIEVRLASAFPRDGAWPAILLGEGTWRQPTEHRGPPPLPALGERIDFGPSLAARVASVSPASARLVFLRFEGTADALWPALFRVGRPVQYSHLCGPLELWDVQTAYAARPWAVEMPSAGRALTLGLLAALNDRGAAYASLTHAAGLSSTGDPSLDALLPLPERYEIPEATAEAVARTRANGGRVVAAGTSVVRALESSAARHAGRATAESAWAELTIGGSFEPQIVDGVLSGIHEAGTSHRRLLEAFAPAEILDRAFEQAERSGYLGHEFGDLALVL